jgi:1-acyl-sn-glycerol-3-phosphate acyltransferase
LRDQTGFRQNTPPPNSISPVCRARLPHCGKVRGGGSEKPDLLLFHVSRLITWTICRLYFRIRYRGLENVPREGPFILAPNHVSFIDPVWVASPLARPMRYMTWERFVRMPGLGALIRFYGGFPVRLEAGDRAALRQAVGQLKAGGPLMIFPEGGRTRTGKTMPFKPGFIRLALETSAPIVPVTIIGGYAAFAPHHRFPRPHRVVVIYHPPITLAPPDNPDEMKDYLYQQCARIRQIITAETPDQATVSPVQVGHLRIQDDSAGCVRPDPGCGDLKAGRGETRENIAQAKK